MTTASPSNSAAHSINKRRQSGNRALCEGHGERVLTRVRPEHPFYRLGQFRNGELTRAQRGDLAAVHDAGLLVRPTHLVRYLRGVHFRLPPIVRVDLLVVGEHSP